MTRTKNPPTQVEQIASLLDEGCAPDEIAVPAPVPTKEAVRAAAVLCRRATSGTDLDDLAGALGIRHAVEPAERWLNARERAAAQYASGTPSTVREGVHRAKERLREHVAGYAIEQPPTGIVVGDVVPPGPRIEVTAGAVTVHQHEPFPVADERGIFHAECECGTRWDRTACDVCGLTVTALVIANTGRARHPWHPED
jgi:hypothetical protein